MTHPQAPLKKRFLFPIGTPWLNKVEDLYSKKIHTGEIPWQVRLSVFLLCYNDELCWMPVVFTNTSNSDATSDTTYDNSVCTMFDSS